MPCYSPLNGYVSKRPNAKGKFPIVFNHRDGWLDRPVSVPCGQCVGCRLERSRQWAVRCVQEASLYDDNCFITLTFDDDNLCPSGSLKKADFQKFMKRLRKRFGAGIRYYHCGEYGDVGGRPHHHACLFNFDFPDRVFWCERDGVRLYVSESLSELWPFGFSTIGDVTFESSAYVARYVMKKITGDKAEEHYGGKLPEYTTMSRRPGIGKPWLDKFQSDVYPHDRVVVRGNIVCKPPKYYDAIYDVNNHSQLLKLKGKRERRCKGNPNNYGKRLLVRKELKEMVIKQLRRTL